MKAKPVRLIYGKGYEPCSVEEATHVTLNIPGPTGEITLPVITKGQRAGTGCWTWNSSTDAPTLRPSILTQGCYPLTEEEYQTIKSGKKIQVRKFRCHTWINDGSAQFLSDCSHDLRDMTVPLIDVDAPNMGVPIPGANHE